MLSNVREMGRMREKVQKFESNKDNRRSRPNKREPNSGVGRGTRNRATTSPPTSPPHSSAATREM